MLLCTQKKKLRNTRTEKRRCVEKKSFLETRRDFRGAPHSFSSLFEQRFDSLVYTR
jgi:hypothetical protein